jgi:hypothetical protein
VFVISDLPACFAPFSRCSYTNYARKARGLSCSPSEGAFQPRFEAYDQVLFTKVNILIQHTLSTEINANIAFSESSESTKVVITILESSTPVDIRFAPDGA